MKSKYSFSQQFKIPNGSDLDFFDITLDKDIEAFLCPFLIANNRENELVDKAYSQMQSFLENLNRNFIQKNDRANGIPFLSSLHEPNEYYLGYSERNKGKAIAKSKAEIIFEALRNNRFSKQGISITNEAHNVLLLVKGIGQDNMSDTIANVCRDLFADFTKGQCDKYSIPTTEIEIEYYDIPENKWRRKKVSLPSFRGKKIILIPKLLVSGGRAYSNLYNWFIASNYLSSDILNHRISVDNEEKFTTKMKDGTRKAIVKIIYQFYKKPKEKLIEFVLKYNGSLAEFLAYAKKHYPRLDLSGLE